MRANTPSGNMYEKIIQTKLFKHRSNHPLLS